MKLLRWIVLPPALLVAISIGASNREPVTLRLEPVPYAMEIPLFAVIFAAVFVGILVGAAAMWLRDGRVRRQARAARSRAAGLERDLHRNEEELVRVRRLARAEGERRAEGSEAA